jgi:SH3-like domain-containing protein
METLEQRMTQGEQARQVLENPAFAKAFDDIEREHVEAWKNSPVRDPEGRETLWMTVKLLYKLRSTLEAAMTDGRLASVELEHQAKQLARERAEGVILR